MTHTHPQQALAHAIRFLSIDAIVKAQEGHQGVPLGMAEIATALYTRHLKFHPQDAGWFDRDRVVLSNGHGSMLLYSLLHLTGYPAFPIEEVQRFRVLGSVCEGHPERPHDQPNGIEVTTGPLGQGIANAFGMAVAEAYLNARFGKDLVNHFTYAFVGDGCLQEGVGQEMISLAGHLQLGKLVLLWDDNQITDDGSTDLSISENVAERFRVAGWHVVELDGHDIDAVSAALDAARLDPRPSMLACRTVIAKGIARLQGQRGGHSGRLFEEDAQAARDMLGWTHGPFEIPADVQQAWHAAGQRSAAEHQAWQARVAALPAAERAEFERVMRGELPAQWQQVLMDYKHKALSAPLAPSGIFISAEINDLLTPVLPERMVGCADLEAPTSHKRGLTAFNAQDRAGSYVHCGVREHVMGSMANGMAAHGGVIPLSVTYLAFADYERPAMRMAALMGLPVKFVFSHDSIGIGRNGPTHQPVEIIASLRAMPNMWVMRPALRSGTLDFSANSQGAVSSVVPEYAALGMPFLFANVQKAWEVMDGPIGKELGDKTAAKGMVLLGLWDNGIRQMSNSKRPIKSPAEMKGLKMRTPPDAVTVDIMQAMGADAQQIKFSELYVALQQGVVDGQENPLTNIASAKLYEVQKYISLSGHKYESTPFLMSKRTWDRMTPADQKVVTEAAAEATQLQRRLNKEVDDKLVAELKSKGAQIDTIDRKAFVDASAAVYTKWTSGPIGDFVTRVVQAAR